jgi:hypothetical protein
VAFLLLAPVRAEEAEPVRRHVIALTNGNLSARNPDHIVHQLLELPLNHCGMVVLTHHVRSGPPPAAWLADARAVVTYFGWTDQPVDWLWPWLENEVAPRNLRVIHFGEFGPLERPDAGRLTRWLERFGLRYLGGYVNDPLRVVVKMRSQRSCRYESDPGVYTIHRGPRNLGAGNRVWIETRDRRRPDDPRSPVVTGPWGGLALDPWNARKGSADNDRRWYLDPFLFFREALGLDAVPAPHPSVLNGRRMWFLQIDGDGFENLSTVRRGAYSAQVMLDEVLLRYRLPYTVSIIVRSLTSDYDVPEPTRAMELASRILSLPHVEPAAHGVLHTLEWNQDLEPTSPPRTIMWYRKLKGYEYSQVNEVRESIRFVNERLLRAPRRCALMLWSGAADPREDAILAAGEMGSLNLNGGVFRWDRWHDSVAYVSPWSRRVGRALQVYAGAANENDFDGFFTTMPGAFAQIDKTIERAGSPLILKPADLYLHFYSAEKPARLKVVHDLIRRWAFQEPTAPVFASTYVRAVNSAVETARILAIPEGWLLRDFGDCRTARLDGEPREVDWSRSTGLLGARRIGRSLYLHLAAPDARVVLGADPTPQPHVEEANCLLEEAHRSPGTIEVTATAHGHRIVVFAGFPPHAPLRLHLEGVEEERQANARGCLAVKLGDPGTTRIRVGLR